LFINGDHAMWLAMFGLGLLMFAAMLGLVYASEHT
jgi:hypothetical protein